MKVKICGITSLEDALMCLDAGADMLGFNFYAQSPRYINPETCLGITRGLKTHIRRVLLVGVFVNADLAKIEATLDYCELHLAQLHGDETPDLLKSLGERAFKAFRPSDSITLESAIKSYPLRAQPPALLIDANQPGSYGGSGSIADWNMTAKIATKHPLLLAGGLNPNNVAEAVNQVQPWGVDVASGVEQAPGRKDAAKVTAFIRAARDL